MAITRDDVFAAAHAIADAGGEPTYLAIRDRLGAGSFSTIARHLKDWKAEGSSRGEEGVVPKDIPAEFSAALTRFGAEAWRVAEAFTKTEIETARRTFEEKARDAESELERAAAAVDALQSELEATRLERDALREKERNAGEQIARLVGEVHFAETRAAELARERGELHERIASLTGERESARTEARTAREDLLAIREEMKAALEKAARAEARAEALERDGRRQKEGKGE